MPNYHDNHYAEMKVQPIEVMQKCMTPEQIDGLLMGQIIKYHMRAGHKSGESFDKDIEKRDRYISWFYQHRALGQHINPKMPNENVPEMFKSILLTNLDKFIKE